MICLTCIALMIWDGMELKRTEVDDKYVMFMVVQDLEFFEGYR
jgi:hypothetical protein